MLRVKVLASTIPLILAGAFAGNVLTPGPRPCIAIGETSVQMTAVPWKAQSLVRFTSDPAQATVRVQIVENPEAADFVVVDDDATPQADSCGETAATRFIAITEDPARPAPVIYLTQTGSADYRVYVKSRTFTPQDAAALLVGTNGGRSRLAAASL